jgi:CubicO group peptidase (beta-lactamase class C family)
LGPIPVSAQTNAPPPIPEQKAAFARDFLVGQGGEGGVRPTAGLAARLGELSGNWQPVASESSFINLAAAAGRATYALAYAYTEVVCPAPTKLVLATGSDDAIKVWLNGKLIQEKWPGRPFQPDQDLTPAELRQGTNSLLVKVQNQQGEWGFAGRFISPADLQPQMVRASGKGDLETVELMLSLGASPNSRETTGLSAWQAARIHGYQELADLLVKRGADPQLPAPLPERLVEALFTNLLQGSSPGAAVLVAQDGRVLFAQGFGYANLEHSLPITPQTKFRIGSVTKQFTAAAILRLQEEGKLKVSDPLARFLPDYPRAGQVTLHHLLTHTSGIHCYTDKADFLSQVTQPIEPEKLLRSFQDDPYDFAPGKSWRYSNSGYFLLGYLVEKVSVNGYERYLSNNFFEPLGMKDTGVHRRGLRLSNEATGYSFDSGKVSLAKDWDMSWAGGAGCLYSTVEDLHRWSEALFSGKVLKEESLQAALTPARLKDGKEPTGPLAGGYAYGLVSTEYRGLRLVHHGGGLHGFASLLAAFPDQKLTVIILANAAPFSGLNASALAQEIAEIYLWDKMKPKEISKPDVLADPQTFAAYAGRYDYSLGLVMEITYQDGHLYAQLTAQARYEIFPKGRDEFFWKVVEARVCFEKDDQDKVVRAVHYQGGQKIIAPRLPDLVVAQVDPALYDQYTGQYDFGGGALILAVTREGSQLFAQLTGQPRLELLPISETDFAWRLANARITFVKDTQGRVTKAIHEQAGRRFEVPKLRPEQKDGEK